MVSLSDHMQNAFGVTNHCDLATALPHSLTLDLEQGSDRHTKPLQHFLSAHDRMMTLLTLACRGSSELLALFPVIGGDQEAWLQAFDSAKFPTTDLRGGTNGAPFWQPVTWPDLPPLLWLEAADGITIQPGGPGGLVILCPDLGIAAEFWQGRSVTLRCTSAEALTNVEKQITAL